MSRYTHWSRGAYFAMKHYEKKAHEAQDQAAHYHRGLTNIAHGVPQPEVEAYNTLHSRPVKHRRGKHPNRDPRQLRLL